MDEEAMAYYKDEREIFPRKNLLFAFSYFMKLLGILLKQKENKELYHRDILKAMKKLLNHFGVKSQELPAAETCEDII